MTSKSIHGQILSLNDHGPSFYVSLGEKCDFFSSFTNIRSGITRIKPVFP